MMGESTLSYTQKRSGRIAAIANDQFYINFRAAEHPIINGCTEELNVGPQLFQNSIRFLRRCPQLLSVSALVL